MTHQRGIRIGLGLSLMGLLALGCVDVAPAGSPSASGSADATLETASAALDTAAATTVAPRESGP